MISLRNISKVYKRKQSEDEVVALDNLSLELPEVGFVSILGASGSGKTTLLNIIGGIDKPTNGEMIVDGLNASSFKGKDWDSYRNNKIGIVLQNCYLLPHLNVRDNIAVKLQINGVKDIEPLIDEALKKVDLLDKKYDKPKALSGGQRQRVAIARALIGNPTVILADEPTGSLDSKNGKLTMELLKSLSKDHLIVVVTHNKDYAEKYSDRIIELSDGKIVRDSNPIKACSDGKIKNLSKVRLPYATSVKWAFKNTFIKKFSSIAIVLASALGLAGVGLILSISKGVESAFVDTESKSLAKYPVQINSYSDTSREGSESHFVPYTNEPVVFVDLSSYAKQKHSNFMSERFLNYMEQMPTDYYYLSYKASVTNFQLFAQVNETSYKSISSTSYYFYKGLDNEAFIKGEYDCLAGHFPTNEHEVLLVVDSCNRINGNDLKYLGFDVDTSHYSETTIDFVDIVGDGENKQPKTYKYVPVGDYFEYDSETDTYNYSSKTDQELYESSTYELRICGIIREKRNSTNPLLETGIMYTTAFLNRVIEDANTCPMVMRQLEDGLSRNVLTGEAFTDVQYGSMHYSKEYVYESLLFTFGQFERVTTLYFFTEDFASRNLIHEYYNQYVKDDTVDFSTLKYNDYLEKVTDQFDGAISLMTSVLYVFVGISVFISAVLNGILTHVSIHQRTNEIGLLRSMGARRIDIALMIETESLITGLLGGVFSVLLSLLLVDPVNILIKNAIYDYKFYLLSTTTFELGGFKWWVAPIMIGIGLVTAILSALIPSLIASRKNPAKAINE